jgi:GntR family transcriptional regulator
LLDTYGAHVATALTEVHAASGKEVGWGKRPLKAKYVMLSQVHYLDNARPVMFSNTFFVEGRFTFSLIRTR